MIHLPDWAVDIWAKFCAVSGYRDEYGRIMPTEVKAWACLSGVRITPLEFRLLGVIDTAYLESKKDGK